MDQQDIVSFHRPAEAGVAASAAALGSGAVAPKHGSMNLGEAVAIATSSLWAHKLRSILTLLGVVIGVAAVIAVVSLINGANQYVATRAELEMRANALFEMIADKKLKLRIEHIYPLQEAQQAHRDLEGRKTTGKLLLLP